MAVQHLGNRVHFLMAMLYVAVLASCSRVNFEGIETGRPYTGQYQGRDCVVVFDHAVESNLDGRIYLDSGSIVATPIAFTSDLNSRGKGSLRTAHGEKRLKKMSLKTHTLQGKVDKTRAELTLSEQCSAEFRPMYIDSCYATTAEQGRVYARSVKGYWASYPDTRESFGSIYLGKVSELVSARNLNLDMDVYYPQTPPSRPRPLLLLIHGGAFYNGDKQAVGYPEMGRYFAQRGYVVASINYRLGFKPMAADVDRAGYRALQDAYAAARFLLNNADEYGIDTSSLFVAGTSAGAITALNLAFMREPNRPESTREEGVKAWLAQGVSLLSKGVGKVAQWLGLNIGVDSEELCQSLGLDSDLGPIESVSGKPYRPLPVKAVVNMWGAVHDLSVLRNSPRTAILSFHGDADRIVPYASGYPFDRALESSVDEIIEGLPHYIRPAGRMMQKWMSSGRPVNEWAFNPMHGSRAIHNKAASMRMHSEMHTAAGGGHSLHVDAAGKLSRYYYDTIVPAMTDFLCRELVGERVRILRNGSLWLVAQGASNTTEIHWVVEGGAVVRSSGADKVKVMLFGDADKHAVTACGQYLNGVDFRETVFFDAAGKKLQ